jgi:dimeric dUTPase (all-alpha-NTP-PPase superfamily)
MKVDFKSLETIQLEVNKVVIERLEKMGKGMPSQMDYLVAMHVEFFEFINAVGTFKFWKHSHNPEKERVLDELADIIAFFLSIGKVGDDVDPIIEETEQELKDYSTLAIIQSVSAAIQTGEEAATDVILMGIAVEIARREVGATWEEIVEAYKKKSEENINRQKEGY